MEIKEIEKMLSGQWYDPSDEQLRQLRLNAKDQCYLINQTLPSQQNIKLHQVFSHIPLSSTILSPLMVDYGIHLEIEEDVFVNHQAYFMDCAKIHIGKRTFIGPNCGLYTAIHPENPEMRATGMEKALPIWIGEDVWIGGNVTILPGVTIGDRSIIGAGSIVVKDIPSDVVAVGNPCRVIRKILKK